MFDRTSTNMARPKNTYGRSEETYEVTKNHVGPISEEYPCNDSHIYAIKDGRANDPYPPFRHWFRTSSRAGAPVEVYLRDLQGIVEASRPASTSTIDLVARLSEKINADSNSTSEILNGISDNQLDRRECQRILDAVQISEDINSGIRRLVELQLAKLNDGLKIVG